MKELFKGKKEERNTLDPTLKKFDSNEVVRKGESGGKDHRDGRHGSSRDDAERGRDA